MSSKRGRPSLGDKVRKRVNIAADPVLHARWVAWAKREGVSLSELIERAMTALETHC